MSEPITNPTPKARFQTSKDNCSKHRTMVDSPEFQRGLDFAHLQYELEVTNQNRDFNACAASAMKLQGALEFMGVLRNLAEPPPPVPARSNPPANLNHSV